MKNLSKGCGLLSLLSVLFFSCSEKKSEPRFLQYFNTLPEVTLPFETSSNESLPLETKKDTAFAEFHEYNMGVIGKRKINDSVYAIIDVSVGDIIYPSLTTYTIRGEEISSLLLLHLPGGSDGYSETGRSFLKIDKKFEISITDSLETFLRDTLATGEPIIKSSIRKKVIVEKYKVSPTGIIVAQP